MNLYIALIFKVFFFVAGSMIKWQIHAGSFLWEAVQMGVAITTTRTQLFEAVTGLSRLTYMFLGVHHRVRPYSMHHSSCKRRLEGGGIVFIGGISDTHQRPQV